MGHERVGSLPKSKRWRTIVGDIAAAADYDGDVSLIAAATLENLRGRLANIHTDQGFLAAFQFLVALSVEASPEGSSDTAIARAIDFDANPSPLQLSRQLNTWIQQHQDSAEYAELARKAATDTIAQWTSQQNQQLTFLPEPNNALSVWRSASDPGGFCQVSRLYFSHFVSRYLNYFLGREASATLDSTSERTRFASRLSNHVDSISHHAFETTRISQSFAAGWYALHASQGMPSQRETERFLALATAKISNELRREQAQP